MIDISDLYDQLMNGPKRDRFADTPRNCHVCHGFADFVIDSNPVCDACLPDYLRGLAYGERVVGIARVHSFQTSVWIRPPPTNLQALSATVFEHGDDDDGG